MRGPCPTCGADKVAPQGLGKAACGACGARYYSLHEATTLLASAGIDPAMLKQLVAEHSYQRHADPLWEGTLKTVVVKGLEAHFSLTGQAIWLPRDAAERIGVDPMALPAVPLTPTPVTTSAHATIPLPSVPPRAPESARSDPMASLGLPSGPSHGLPLENRANDEPSLELAVRAPAVPRTAANPYEGFPVGGPARGTAASSRLGELPGAPSSSVPSSSLPSSSPASSSLASSSLPSSSLASSEPAYGAYDDMAPPLPSHGGAGQRMVTESAFAAKAKSPIGAIVALVVKLGILVGVVAAAWFGYQEVQSRLVWPRVEVDWGYTVILPSKPPPELSRRDFSLATAKILSWHDDDTGLTLSVIYADVGLTHEDFVMAAVREAFGERLQIEGPASHRGLRYWRVEVQATDDRPGGVGRLWIDDNGRGFITMATAPEARTLRQSNVTDFVKSLLPEGDGEDPDPES